MLAAHLRRGVAAGLVAGLIFGLFLALVAAPLVGVAEDLGHGEDAAVEQHGGQEATDEHHDAAADGHAHEAADGHDHGAGDGHAAVPDAVASAASVLGGVLWGVLLGGVVFGVGYCFLEPAIPGTGATKSYVLGTAGFVSVSGAPWLVVPPRSPGVEATLPTETRLALYAGMVVLGALVCVLAGVLYARLRDWRGRPTAAAVAALSFGLLAIPAALSPVETGTSGLPAALAAGLTGTVVFGQALLWLLLAGTHAHLRRRPAAAESAGVAPARADGSLASGR